MKRKLIKISESDIHNIIKNTVSKILRESSYDANGNFDEKSHNNDLKMRLTDEIMNVNQSINDALTSLDNIAQMSTDEYIKRVARTVINALLNAGREMQPISQLSRSNRL